MKILMTGGLGFLGSHSIEKYQSEGFDITIIDNLSSNVIQPDDELCKNCDVIIDDILDVTSSSEVLGKTAGKDLIADKSTYPKLLGLDESRNKAKDLIGKAKDAIQPWNEKASPLLALAE